MSIITQPTDESKEAMQAKYQAVPPVVRSGGGGDLPEGGTEGQVLTMGSTEPEWADPASELPEGGTEGQVLTMGSTEPEWSDPIAIPSNVKITITFNGEMQTGGVYSDASVSISDTHGIISRMNNGDYVPIYVSFINNYDYRSIAGVAALRKVNSQQYKVMLMNGVYGVTPKSPLFNITGTLTPSEIEGQYTASVEAELVRPIAGITDGECIGVVSALPTAGNSASITSAMIYSNILSILQSPNPANHYPFYMTWKITPMGESEAVSISGLSTAKFTVTDPTVSLVVGTYDVQTIAVVGTALYVVDAQIAQNGSAQLSVTSATLKRVI